MSLYRPEAVEAQRKRLYGHVTIHQPASAMVMTGVAAGVTVLAAVFVTTGSISRKETVGGWIVPDRGLAQIYAAKGGVAQSVLVKVGDEVKADQPLAMLSEDVSTGQGDLAPQQRAMTRQRIAELDGQLGSSALKSQQEAARLMAHARALRDEADHLVAERKLVEQQLAIARRQFSDIQPLVAKGFVATVEKDRREQIVFSTEQSLTDLTRQIDSKRSEAGDADAQARALPTTAAMDASQLRAQKSALQQTLAELATQDSTVLKAPIAGRVAAINIHPGDTVSQTGPAISIAPSSGSLVAELLAPSKAAGFIARGQKVRLLVDAFPSERFGEIEATIDTVSRAPVLAAQVGIPIDMKEPAYRITATLAKDYVDAYGKRQPLQPGMTFKASVVTAKRTFLQWFLDPLVAAGRHAG
jgi:membrane fusion protein